MNRIRRTALGLLAATALAAAGLPAAAQSGDWPSKPVRILVPSPPGVAPDIIARLLGERLAQLWKQPVVVENKPGAGGVIGMAAAKAAAADDHQLVFVPASTLTLTPYMFPSKQVDIVRDFQPIVLSGLSPMMAAVRADNAAASLADVVRQARANPNFVVSTTAQFSVPHLAVDLLSQAAGTPIRAVPFANSGQSITAVVNGDAQMMIDGVPPIDPMIKGGRLKAVAIFADERLPKRAALATAAETYPGLVINGWFGVLAPNGTSARAQARVHADISAILAQPDVVERLDGLGVYPRAMSQAQFAEFVSRERARWEQVLRNVGAKPLQE